MEINYSDTPLDIEMPQKARRNQTKKILDEFIASDKIAVSITCDTIKEATNLNCGLYNNCTRLHLKIKVWRKENIVCMQKEDSNGQS